MTEWQNRPLDAVYPVLFVDAIHLKVRDGQVTNRPFYVVIGVTVDGGRDILGIGPPVATLEGDFDAPGVEGHLAFECEAFLGLCRRWRDLPTPTIAQVQGRVIAAGLMLVWPMDLVVASTEATFADPITALGVDGHEYFTHAYELGARRAKYLPYTGDAMTAAEAQTVGMVNSVVPLDELESSTLDLALRIAGRSAFGNRLAETAVNRSQDTQGMQQAIDDAFALHQVGHANNLARHGTLVDPAGVNVLRRPRP